MKKINLSGVWNGAYELSAGYRKELKEKTTQFIMVLNEVAGEFSGYCVDEYDDIKEVIKADIKSFFDGNLISFIKQYPFLVFFKKIEKEMTDKDSTHHEIEYTGYYNQTYKNFGGNWQMVTRTRVARFTGFKIKKVLNNLYPVIGR